MNVRLNALAIASEGLHFCASVGNSDFHRAMRFHQSPVFRRSMENTKSHPNHALINDCGSGCDAAMRAIDKA